MLKLAFWERGRLTCKSFPQNLVAGCFGRVLFENLLENHLVTSYYLSLNKHVADSPKN